MSDKAAKRALLDMDLVKEAVQTAARGSEFKCYDFWNFEVHEGSLFLEDGWGEEYELIFDNVPTGKEASDFLWKEIEAKDMAADSVAAEVRAERPLRG